MSANAVEVKDLVKTYPKILAVNNISFNIKKGEVFGLLGPNGAGKTTTIRMLLTLIPQTSGSIHIFGYDTISNPGPIRQLAGYVPQDISVDGELTGYENMLMYAKLYDVPRSTRKILIKEALEYMDLNDRAKDLVKTYSGGMMRRLEIAQTLVNRPKILYLDEPSIGLDPKARTIIWKHIENLKKEFGTTILITTHDMNEADRLCTRIGIMNRGKLITVGETAKLKAAIGGDIINISSKTRNLAKKLEALKYTVLPGQTSNNLELVMENGENKIPNLLTALNSNGIKVESVSVKRPTLDDVFLHFTGSHIEEDEPTAETDSFAQAKRTRRTFRRMN